MTRKGTRLSALAVLAVFVSLPVFAQWSESAMQLAREVAAITGPGTVTLTVRNLSSLSADHIPVIKRDLQTDLRAAGVSVVDANAAAGEVRLTLSENAQGYIWVAEIRQSNDTKVVMVTAPRSQAGPLIQTGPLVAIRKNLVWSQDAAILDVALLPAVAEPHMIVLDPSGVSLYKLVGGVWSLEQQLPIPPTRTWPRDLRGRLSLARDHLFDAYLPGVVCASTAKPPLGLNCRTGDDPWPIAASPKAMFGASRNFFTGVVTPAIGKLASVPAFYSVAGFDRPKYTLWVFARTDGSVHLMDGVNDVSARAREWGSDLAAIKSSCGAQTQLLVTGTGDAETADVVRAFEIADREPVEVSAPVEFAGPVTALWTSSDAHTATAVARNLKTGKYEAFELAIACGQ